jgi:hypothetical protein
LALADLVLLMIHQVLIRPPALWNGRIHIRDLTRPEVKSRYGLCQITSRI